MSKDFTDSLDARQPMYVSVTIDFLKAINPEWDVENNNTHLVQALFLCGFHLQSKVDRMTDMYVRYVHAPQYARPTTVYQGRLRNDYHLAGLYAGKEILDLDITNTSIEISKVVDFLAATDQKMKVTDFAFDVDTSYVGVKGHSDLKNQYVSKEDKCKYHVMNRHEQGIEEILKCDDMFESPYMDK